MNAIGIRPSMPAWMSTPGVGSQPAPVVPARTNLDAVTLGQYPEPMGYVATGKGTLVLGALALGPVLTTTALGGALPSEVALPLMLGSLVAGAALATAAMHPIFEHAEKTYEATGHGTALAKPFFNEEETVWRPW